MQRPHQPFGLLPQLFKHRSDSVVLQEPFLVPLSISFVLSNDPAFQSLHILVTAWTKTI